MTGDNREEYTNNSLLQQIYEDFKTMWRGRKDKPLTGKVANVDAFLSIVLSRSIETRNSLNFLKEKHTDDESRIHFERIEHNLKTVQSIYEKILLMLLDVNEDNEER